MSRKKGLSLIQIFMYDARMYCTVKQVKSQMILLLFLQHRSQTVDKGASSCEAVRISGGDIFFLLAISAAVPFHPGILIF